MSFWNRRKSEPDLPDDPLDTLKNMKGINFEALKMWRDIGGLHSPAHGGEILATCEECLRIAKGCLDAMNITPEASVKELTRTGSKYVYMSKALLDRERSGKPLKGGASTSQMDEIERIKELGDRHSETAHGGTHEVHEDCEECIWIAEELMKAVGVTPEQVAERSGLSHSRRISQEIIKRQQKETKH